MKSKTIILLLAVLFIFSCIVLSGCGTGEDIVTEVRYTAYDNGDGDLISFYMTSDIDSYGKWEYSLDNSDMFTYFFDSEKTEDFGIFGKDGTVSYRTLILEPIAEGETTISFSLTQGETEYQFSIKVEKDENGLMRIKAEEIKE